MTHLSQTRLLISLATLCSLSFACAAVPGEDTSFDAQAGNGGMPGSGGMSVGGSAGVAGTASGWAGASATACPPDTLCTTGVPFVTGAFANTDAFSPGGAAAPEGATTATLTNSEPGKLCLSGRVRDGFAAIVLAFLTEESAVVQQGLDVQVRGIKSLRLTVEAPPAAGLGVELASVVPGCRLGDQGCVRFGYYFSASTTTFAAVSLAEGTVVAPLANFLRADWIDTTWQLDLKNLGTLSIGLGLPQRAEGDYAFCVKDFAFLDASGNPVQPQ